MLPCCNHQPLTDPEIAGDFPLNISYQNWGKNKGDVALFFLTDVFLLCFWRSFHVSPGCDESKWNKKKSRPNPDQLRNSHTTSVKKRNDHGSEAICFFFCSCSSLRVSCQAFPQKVGNWTHCELSLFIKYDTSPNNALWSGKSLKRYQQHLHQVSSPPKLGNFLMTPAKPKQF